ncbi:hypothetical protein M011DRAFT_408923, partial [Sporormia fimetaria CBS 119925]
ERLICKTSLCEELIFPVRGCKVLVIDVIVRIVLIVILLSPSTLAILVCISTAFVFPKVHSKIGGWFYPRKVTCREKLCASGFSLLVRMFGRPAALFLTNKTLLFPLR